MVVLSLVVPLSLLTAALYYHSSSFAVAFAIYVAVFAVSETARKLGRAGYVPRLAKTQKVVVVGGGWSWVLQRRMCPANAIVCQRGETGRAGWWHAGTTIREVQACFARRGKTLAGHPSILSATLGGWIASRSHGSGGSLWTPTMGRVVVEDATTGERKELMSKKHVADDMIVREVELKAVNNVPCERVLSYLEREADVSSFAANTYLRAVFVDKHSCLAVAWKPCEALAPFPSCPEVPPLWLMTLLPAYFRHDLNVDAWKRRMTLRDANAFAPDPPFLLVTSVMSTHTNFEVFVEEPTTPRLIWTLCSTFRSLFASNRLKGRLEVRFGRGIQFLDFDMLGCSASYHVVFSTLSQIYGPNLRMRLHPGKCQVSTE